jgi:pimeloyl-ACP methyl ester carboxylesterase
LAAKRPKLARVEVFPEAGHALFIDEPEKFNRILSQFAQKTWANPLNVR